MLTLNTQFFATNMNTVGYTGTNGQTNAVQVADQAKTFYSEYLIDMANPKLVHEQFGDKYPIPKNKGTSIEFRKYSPLHKATTALTEGITPEGNKLVVNTVPGEIKQYGDFIQMTDMLDMTAIDNNVVQATKLLGAQAGKTLDTVAREVLNTGTNVWYAPAVAGAEPTKADKDTPAATVIADRKALTSACKLTVDLIYRVAAFLKTNNADTIDGAFVAIVHPHVAYDLMKDPDWKDANTYVDSKNLYSGELGRIGGVRFVESSEAKIWNDPTNDNTPSGLAVYSTLVIGAHAYGVTEVTGGGLKHIVKQLGYGDDPLNQRSSCGWKATRAIELLVPEYMVRIESCSSYGNVPAN